jgi:hypothetical protein
MKKLLILSVLLGLMALPMFASDFSFGGDVTFGFIGDFGDAEAENATLTFDIKATVDDYNSLVIEVDFLDAADIGNPDKAVVTTDVGAWLDLPVGLTTNWGWDDPDANEFHNISAYSNEEVFDFSKGDYWGHQFLLSASMLEVEVAFNPGIADGVGPEYGALLAGVAVKEAIPGLNAEVYYYQGGSAAAGAPEVDEFDLGQIMFDAAYSTEFSGVGLDAGAAFFYNLDDAAAYAWAYGIAAAASVSMLDATLGLNGDENETLYTVSASAVIAPIDLVDVYAGLWYDMADSELVEVDLGVNAHIGAAEMYVGYLIGGDSTYDAPGDNFNAPTGLGAGESGAYIKFDIDY